jgi:hypothetical protein
MTSIKKTAAALAALGIAAFALAQSGQGFHFYGPVSRYVTPSTQNSGHAAVFCFDNPQNSGVTGQIFNLVGRQVDTFISSSPGSVVDNLPSNTPTVTRACNQTEDFAGSLQFAVWDGTSNGTFVHSGIYVYRVEAEEKTYTGTLVVVK